ncbi:MAG: nicotinate-nicotinamide nucleotide adenylyltransferase [Planctomycetota bacterium]
MNANPPIQPDIERLLLAGGTFDPPHRAHLRMAVQVAEATDCEQVLFMPARRSPHKMGEDQVPTPALHRVAMLEIALRELRTARSRTTCSEDNFDVDSGTPVLSLSMHEVMRPPPSYTVDTLEALREHVGEQVEIRLLMGADQVIAFERWHAADRILQLASPAVVLRPPLNDWAALREAAPQLDERWSGWLVPDIELDPVSATDIRERIRRDLWASPDAHPQSVNDEPPASTSASSRGLAADCASPEPLDELVPPEVLQYIREHNLYRPK